MTGEKPRKLFVNIPVEDLKRSIDFFRQLGFSFDPRFTDETATCMIVGDDAYFMLLTQERFTGFIRKSLADAQQATGALYAISVNSREEVDDMVRTALRNGGAPALEPFDHGFMYGSSFYDPDGHNWEVFFMDETAMA